MCEREALIGEIAGALTSARILSKRVRFQVLLRDKFTCQYCGAKAPDVALQIDHIVPVSRGGSRDMSNLRTACEPCNAGKSASIVPGDEPDPDSAAGRLAEVDDAVRLAKIEWEATGVPLRALDLLIAARREVPGSVAHRRAVADYLQLSEAFSA
ncbi:MAG: HNH endonuclease [Alphaproteobacteria bacterium]|nr:HNH endonuclease [Alphaproteobacteria bacterium]